MRTQVTRQLLKSKQAVCLKQEIFRAVPRRATLVNALSSQLITGQYQMSDSWLQAHSQFSLLDSPGPPVNTKGLWQSESGGFQERNYIMPWTRFCPNAITYWDILAP